MSSPDDGSPRSTATIQNSWDHVRGLSGFCRRVRTRRRPTRRVAWCTAPSGNEDQPDAHATVYGSDLGNSDGASVTGCRERLRTRPLPRLPLTLTPARRIGQAHERDVRGGAPGGRDPRTPAGCAAVSTPSPVFLCRDECAPSRMRGWSDRRSFQETSGGRGPARGIPASALLAVESGRYLHSTSTRSVSDLVLLWTVTDTVCGPVLGRVKPSRITCPTVQPGWLAMVM